MATKEDILEQVVEEYLIHRGYFVQHNVKFLPRRDHPDFVSNQDSNHSDIDVLGFHPCRTGVERVIAVSCKSWQQGFRPASEIAAIEDDKTVRGRKAWKAFRELTKPKWSEAFIEAVFEATGQREFTYVTAVANLRGSAEPWESHPRFQRAMRGNPLRILTFQQMIDDLAPLMSTTLAATEVGRLLQMFVAAGFDLQQSGRSAASSLSQRDP